MTFPIGAKVYFRRKAAESAAQVYFRRKAAESAAQTKEAQLGLPPLPQMDISGPHDPEMMARVLAFAESYATAYGMICWNSAIEAALEVCADSSDEYIRALKL
jgi:hypothetical protein